jgi:transcription elongation factor Elf1
MTISDVLAQPDADGRRKRGKRSATFTSTPDVLAPTLTCPKCDGTLLYKHTVISGVKPIERWDYFECHACGPYVYRERTRALRPAI